MKETEENKPLDVSKQDRGANKGFSANKAVASSIRHNQKNTDSGHESIMKARECTMSLHFAQKSLRRRERREGCDASDCLLGTWNLCSLIQKKLGYWATETRGGCRWPCRTDGVVRWNSAANVLRALPLTHTNHPHLHHLLPGRPAPGPPAF